MRIESRQRRICRMRLVLAASVLAAAAAWNPPRPQVR
jgi:hypothetical protein